MNIFCAVVCEVVRINEKLWEMIQEYMPLHLLINSPLSFVKQQKWAYEATMPSEDSHSYIL